MPAVKTSERQFPKRVKDILASGLKTAGLDADIQTKPIPSTRLYRVMVVAPKFRKLKSYERQDLVWRMLGQHLTHDEQLRISTILTLTPDEMKERGTLTS